VSEALESLRIVGIAAALGALLGLERELARKPAGLRTHVLVAVASAVLMLVGSGMAERFAREQDAVRVTSDPLRVMEAIVVGISFLGAGTIIHAGRRVEGLTTAASILVTAAVGLAVAAGDVWFAAALSAGVVVLLVVLGRVEHWLGTDEPSNAEQRAVGAERAASADLRERPASRT
jgi:putative Mg2+ transporter-C (MgtC) family protein